MLCLKKKQLQKLEKEHSRSNILDDRKLDNPRL